MSTPGKYRQRKYKKRLRALKKKEVSVNLSEKSYERLVKKKKETGKNYSDIIDESLLGVPDPKETLRNISLETGKELHDILNYFDDLKKKHAEEHIKHTRNVFKRLDKEGAAAKKHDDASDRYFNDLLEHSYDTIYRFNYIENRFDYINTSSKEMLKSVNEFKSMDPDVSLAEYIHSDDLQKVLDHFDFSKTTNEDDISPTIEFCMSA